MESKAKAPSLIMVLRLQLPPETWTQLPGRGRLWTGVPCVQIQLARRLLVEAGVRISTLISCLHFFFHPPLILLWFSSSCSHYNKSVCLIIIFTCDSFFFFLSSWRFLWCSWTQDPSFLCVCVFFLLFIHHLFFLLPTPSSFPCLWRPSCVPDTRCVLTFASE